MIVAHITTAHHRSDDRIRSKEVAALAEALDGAVTLLVQDGEGSEAAGAAGVRVVDTGPPSRSRLLRMTRGSWRMWRDVRAIRPGVVHFHDPELIFVGLLMKASGAKVVYDVHEDVPRQILSKRWIPTGLRRPVARAVQALEWMAAAAFDAVVPATPRIAERFPAHKTVVVQNFPIRGELTAPDSRPYRLRPAGFAYVGGITAVRGAREMVQAIGLLPEAAGCALELVGDGPAWLLDELETAPGWSLVRCHGWVSRPEVARILGRVRAGLVVLHPTASYVEAYPVKMFEYMAAGLPVIASDFPLWREIVAGAGAGLLVAPSDPQAIADAMQWVLDHPEEAEAMGQRGRRAVEERYNWQYEKTKLIGLYEALLGERAKIAAPRFR